MGAWIETTPTPPSATTPTCRTLMGAWIETMSILHAGDLRSVAPYMGAWIETNATVLPNGANERRTLYGCVD